MIHYSVRRRATLCGRDIMSANLLHVDSIDVVDCKKCLKKYKEREALIKKHGVVE